jgi:hypothetical protein
MCGVVEGRIVWFVFDDATAGQVNRDRRTNGTYGPPVSAGDTAPAMIVKVHGAGEYVNLKVNLDGPDGLWVTSVPFVRGGQPRSCHWPPTRVQ